MTKRKFPQIINSFAAGLDTESIRPLNILLSY